MSRERRCYYCGNPTGGWELEVCHSCAMHNMPPSSEWGKYNKYVDQPKLKECDCDRCTQLRTDLKAAQDRITELEAERDELRRALKPLVEICDASIKYAKREDKPFTLLLGDYHGEILFKKAAALLKGKENDDEAQETE